MTQAVPYYLSWAIYSKELNSKQVDCVRLCDNGLKPYACVHLALTSEVGGQTGSRANRPLALLPGDPATAVGLRRALHSCSVRSSIVYTAVVVRYSCKGPTGEQTQSSS